MERTSRLIQHEMQRIDKMTKAQALESTLESNYFSPIMDEGIYAKIEPLVIRNPKKIKELFWLQMKSFKELNPEKEKPYYRFISMLDARGDLFYNYSFHTEIELEEKVLSGEILPKRLVAYTLFVIDMSTKERRSIHLCSPFVFCHRQARIWLMDNYNDRFFFCDDKELMKEIKIAGGEVYRFPLGKRKKS
ncbi:MULTISPECIES: hypothetical protein [Flammeovirga]|uniref:Uncharacterized protein n=1 Tax=Flammeovirga agarivorans TaxID=2726742 RepID=A0A7X8XW75_9BACT|nr:MULTISPECIES: hypothetical protein [Flammeovirga]NLR91820.1 hypothetical protein [Flammeovirga agarivorans]